jgi:hypothetical protein
MGRRSVIAISFAVSLALLLPAGSSAGTGIQFFHTADGNIQCAAVKRVKKSRKKHRSALPGGARCDVKSHTWTAPPKPNSCDLDWGSGVDVGDKGPGQYVCAGDTVADQPKSFVLTPGVIVVVGRYSCTIPSTDPNVVRCSNTGTGHGFEVSAAAVQLF